MPEDKYAKRPVINKRPPTRTQPTLMPFRKGAEIVKDVASGFRELKRQSGSAVENIKEGVRKIKSSVRP